MTQRPTPLQELKSILDDGNRNFPFNNIATVCRLMGETPPEKMGGDCYEQVSRTVGQIREAGHEALFMTSGVHFGVLAQDGEDQFYLDPTLNMREAVRIGDIAEVKEGSVVVPTYPIVKGTSSAITATLDGSELHSLWEKAVLSPSGEPKLRGFQRNTFNLAGAQADANADPERVREFFKDLVPRMHWNVVEPKTGEVVTLTVDQSGVSLRSSERKGRIHPGSKEFDELMELSGRATGLSRAELDEFIQLGMAKFKELKSS